MSANQTDPAVMRILFDEQIFSMQRWGGISRYFERLYHYLQVDEGVSCRIAAWCTNNKYCEDSYSLASMARRGKRYMARGKVGIKANRFMSMLLERFGRYDIFHPTYYNSRFLRRIGRHPFVVTVFDMIHEKAPEWFPDGDQTSLLKRSMVLNADAVIAISETVRSDIIDIFGVSPEKVMTVYLGGGDEVGFGEAPVPDEYGSVPYLLYVGSRARYKNFGRLVDALAGLVRQKRPLCLVCCGGGAFSESEQQHFTDAGIAREVVNHESVSDAVLRGLYRSAAAYISPSLYEGFGITLVEAMREGCPLLVADIPVFREIAADAACYFDPYSAEAMAGTIETICDNQALRDRYRESGKARSAAFSWANMAVETKKVYDAVLRNRS